MRPDGNGKGDKPRPFSVTQKEYAERWDAIFRRDLKEEKVKNESSDSNTDNRK